MTAKQLLYFVTIAETGSYTLAAEKLNLSQPPLSKQIMLLEEELNTQLLIRSSRRIKLTESGVLLYSRAKDILRMMDSAASDLHSMAGKIGGLIRLGVARNSGDLLLNNKLNALLSRCPNITLDLHESSSLALLESLKNGALDAAIVEAPVNTDGLECKYLPEDSYVAIGHDNFFPQDARRITANDLICQPLIYCRFDEHTIINHFEQAGLPHRCLAKTCDIRTAILMAVNGHGIALVPKQLTRISRPAQDIRVLPLDIPALAMRLAFVYKKNTYPSKALEALIDLF